MFLSYSLDQVTVFLAVVDEGSFSAAGRHLGRAQSAVSHAIAQLEGGLGTTLFDRSGRTPKLTDAGRHLAAEARNVLAQARALAETAARLGAGTEAELCVAVDPLFPSPALEEACQAFREAFPSTALRVEKGLLGDAVGAVRSGRAILGACNLAGKSWPELLLTPLVVVPVLPCCSPVHPLAAQPTPHRATELRRHIQVVHTERGSAHSGDDQGVLAAKTWRVTDLSLKRGLIRRGVGWGSLPSWLIEDDLRAGRLCRLHPEVWAREGHMVPLHSASRRDRTLGPAAQWFRERLAAGLPLAP